MDEEEALAYMPGRKGGDGGGDGGGGSTAGLRQTEDRRKGGSKGRTSERAAVNIHAENPRRIRTCCD
ncbi:hypothetical protein M0802_011111 [Mischocyttarus mexicanus]|nr:hypothetical protein M0802_011111 [Mischocyttarus mexicanus]